MISIEGVNEAVVLWGLSSDTKPTAAAGQTKVPNGAMFICIDNKSVFVYDKSGDR